MALHTQGEVAVDPKDMRDIVRRVPIFRGFTPAQTNRVLEVCEKLTAEKGHCLFREGDTSTEMYILLSGHLRVVTSTGAEIATIWEMGLVGEMGVLTDQPRSATVLADEDSELLCIRGEDLVHLIEEDKDAGYRIYQNMTHLLCERLRDNNILLEQQYLILEDLAGEG
jgi:putative ABC transport system ATP-binding protein